MYHVIGKTKTRTLRVLWMLEELNLDYKHTQSSPHTKIIQQYNPTGKIPVLIDGDTPIIDSIAIITYLADKHNKLTYPAGSLMRARQDSFTHFILDEFDSILWTAQRYSNILPKKHQLPAIKPSLKWEFDRSVATIENRMDPKGPYLMGEKFTIPDIILTHCGGWAYTSGFHLPEGKLKNYCRNQIKRPAYLRALHGSNKKP